MMPESEQPDAVVGDQQADQPPSSDVAFPSKRRLASKKNEGTTGTARTTRAAKRSSLEIALESAAASGAVPARVLPRTKTAPRRGEGGSGGDDEGGDDASRPSDNDAMVLIMGEPELYKEFQDRLKESGGNTSQEVMQKFITDKGLFDDQQKHRVDFSDNAYVMDQDEYIIPLKDQDDDYKGRDDKEYIIPLNDKDESASSPARANKKDLRRNSSRLYDRSSTAAERRERLAAAAASSRDHSRDNPDGSRTRDATSFRQQQQRKKRTGSFASFGSIGDSIGSMGSYLENRIGDILDGPTGGGRKKKNMIKAREVMENETGGLLGHDSMGSIDMDDFGRSALTNRHHRGQNSSSSLHSSGGAQDLHSIPEVVFKGNRGGKKSRGRKSEASMLTDDEDDEDIHDRIDRLERVMAAQEAAGGIGGNDSGDLSVPLSVGDLRGNGSFRSSVGSKRRKITNTGHMAFVRGQCRSYLILITISAVLISVAFRLGMYEGSTSVTSDVPGSNDRTRLPSPNDIKKFVPKVSLALENVLERLEDQTDLGEDDDDVDEASSEAPEDDQGKNPDLFFSGVINDEDDAAAITKSPNKSKKKRTLEVMVGCTHEDACLEAMSLASTVKIDQIATSKMVSIDIEPENFDKLRSIANIRQIDLDNKIEGIEDEIIREHIDLNDKDKDVGVDGSVRGRRDAQSIPPGFEMIQAISKDGTPFAPGPYTRKICIADTGTCKGHPDIYQGWPTHFDGTDLSLFEGTTKLEWDEDRNGHGCHLHGVIGATYNDIGIQGMGGSNIYVTRALDHRKSGSVSQMMGAVNQCANAGASIILLSLGCVGCDGVMPEGFFEDLNKRGIVVVAAAGNNGHIRDAATMLPAGFQSTISVGAVNLHKKRHYMSSANEQVEFCAHGTNIVSTGFNIVGDKYTYDYVEKSGTSVAAPQVAAIISLLWSHYPKCTGNQIREVLARTAVPHFSARDRCDDECGFGIVQLQDAYDLLANSRPGDDYDCAVAGPILSSTDRVCDCIESNYAPSRCLYSATADTTAPWADSVAYNSPPRDLPNNPKTDRASTTITKCADNQAARFKLATPSRNRQLAKMRRRRKNGKKKQGRRARKPVRDCAYVENAKYTHMFDYCTKNIQVQQNCKRTCSFVGVSYDDCRY